MATATTTYPPTTAIPVGRRAVTGAVHAEQSQFVVPRKARLVKDIVWLAVVSMALAIIAVVVGLIDVFVETNLVPLVLGAGLASLTFSILGLTDRLSGRS